MGLWLVRAGGRGEFESKFLSDGRIYLTWDEVTHDLSAIETKLDLYHFLLKLYPDDKPARIRNWTGQIWAIAKEMQPGDWVVLPSKKKASIHVGEITGEYVNVPDAEPPFFHYRTVNWFAPDIPRSNFDQDLLYSFGAFLTICRISRNDAESRIRAMAQNQWKPKTVLVPPDSADERDVADYDIERIARDQIAKYLTRKFKGHAMARIIEAILSAQGYHTYRSPEGPDKGVDLLAAPGSLGFASPKLCVQVKTGDAPVDRPTLDQLIGTMQNYGAEQGLLVSWSGFRSSVDKEVAQQFFRVRLWDQDAIIEKLLENYPRLDDEMKAELPLRQVWALTNVDE